MDPLVELDPRGVPTTLSYNVPDATVYPGKHYVAFDFPNVIFHTIYSDTNYFSFPLIAAPARDAATGAVDPARSGDYMRSVLEVAQAMQAGFRSNGPPDVLKDPTTSTAKAILKVRGPYDRWFPDLGPEAIHLRYAFPKDDPIYAVAAAVSGSLPPWKPFQLPQGNGAAPADYAGVYSVRDHPGGSIAGLSPSVTSLTPYRVVDEAINRRRLVLYRSADDVLTAEFVPVSYDIYQQFYLVEEYRLSSFYGNYGAGRTIKTLSLLPGEHNKIVVKSFRSTSQSVKETSSVLDSFSKQTAEDFQDAIESETTNKDASTRHDEGFINVEVAGNWGTGNAKVSGGFKGSSNSAREQTAKNVSKALQKHALQASAKRDVKVEHSTDSLSESGEESGSERDIRNVNVGNTLNFVFRQMNQEHVSLLCLTDIKVAFSNSTYGSFRQVPLSQIDELLRDYIPNADGPIDPAHPEDYSPAFPAGFTPSAKTPLPPGWMTRIDYVRRTILTECQNVLDYRGALVPVVESVSPGATATTAVIAKACAAERAALAARASGRPVPSKPTLLAESVASRIPPTRGQPRPFAAPYVRFKRTLTTTYTGGANAFTAPGVVLAATHNIMRTDGVIVDAILGQGDGLDPYSHGVQDEAIRAKAIAADALAAQLALEEARQKVVAKRDQTAATLVTQMFPAPR
jgi:hypothetical protein